MGLVPAKRAYGSFREYPPEIATRVRFIKRAQQLGFTLAEVKNLLASRMVRLGKAPFGRNEPGHRGPD